MAIAMVRENVRLPVIGKIRLGIRKETDRGTEYPESVPHFVLHDAPEVAKVIGDKATEFDCFFLTDDVNEAIPNWYKWYGGGKRDKNGTIVGGDLKCYGEGPISIDENGKYTPGKAYHLEKRDAITRVIPTRECMGEQCPDFMGTNGRAQCSPSMTVNVFIPEASLYGIFTIDTKSKVSISRFVGQIELIKEQYGKLKGIPFKIFREPMAMKDPKTGARKTQYILSIKPNEEFFALKGEAIRAKIANVMSQNLLGPSADQMIEAPMEDNVPLIEDQKATQLEAAQSVAEDTEIVTLFNKVAELEGTQAKNTPQQRLLAVRSFEAKNKGKDIRAGMIAYLTGRVSTAAAKVMVPPAEHPLDKLFTELLTLKGTPEKDTPASREAYAKSMGGDLEKMEADLTAKIAALKVPPKSDTPAPDVNGLI